MDTTKVENVYICHVTMKLEETVYTILAPDWITARTKMKGYILDTLGLSPSQYKLVSYRAIDTECIAKVTHKKE